MDADAWVALGKIAVHVGGLLGGFALAFVAWGETAESSVALRIIIIASLAALVMGSLATGMVLALVLFGVVLLYAVGKR